MKSSIPSGAEVKAILLKLEYAEVLKLSKMSGVAVSTIYFIRDHTGEPNPGVNTVRKFLPHVSKAVAG